MTETNPLIDESVEIPFDFPIPRVGTVLVKQINQGELITDTNIIIPDFASNGKKENTNKPNIGLIYAVGPNCKDDLSAGMRVFYNHFVDTEVLVNGRPYIMMDDRDVYCILKPKNYVLLAPKPERQVRLEDKIPKQQAMFNRFEDKKANDKDKMMEINKKNRKK